MRNYFLIILFLFSCEKKIDLTLIHSNENLVIEGYIQQDLPTYVFLTKSQNFFAPFSKNSLKDISVNDAKIYVKRGDGVIHELTYIGNQIIDSLGFIDTLGLPINGMYVDLNYMEDNFAKIGSTYELVIEWNENKFISKTSIPHKYPIDSIWVSRKDELNHFKFYIWARVNDPDTLGNSFTAYYKRDLGWTSQDPLFIPCAISIRDDLIFNSKNPTIRFSRSGRADSEDGVFLPFLGDRIVDNNLVNRDIVLLRIAHINNKTYKFWRSVERNNNNNPFSEPSNLVGNVPGAYGIWGGYSNSFYRIPIVEDTVIYTEISIDLDEMF